MVRVEAVGFLAGNGTCFWGAEGLLEAPGFLKRGWREVDELKCDTAGWLGWRCYEMALREQDDARSDRAESGGSWVRHVFLSRCS